MLDRVIFFGSRKRTGLRIEFLGYNRSFPCWFALRGKSYLIVVNISLFICQTGIIMTLIFIKSDRKWLKLTPWYVSAKGKFNTKKGDGTKKTSNLISAQIPNKKKWCISPRESLKRHSHCLGPRNANCSREWNWQKRTHEDRKYLG